LPFDSKGSRIKIKMAKKVMIISGKISSKLICGIDQSIKILTRFSLPVTRNWLLASAD